MDPDNHEYDSERAWRSPGSSAGQQTQRLPPAQPPQLAPVIRRPNNIAALALLGVGIILLVGRVVSAFVSDNFVPGMILLTIASCFLFFALWRRWYPFLIPGCILAGLSLGVTFVDLTNGASVLWGLALGFVAIHLIGRELFRIRSTWPIFPAVPLFAIGVIITIANMPRFFAFTNALIWLPLLLVGLGWYLGWGRRTA